MTTSTSSSSCLAASLVSLSRFSGVVLLRRGARRVLTDRRDARRLLTGDDPPLDRTSILRKKGFPSRHLGPVQMTTDTALGVVKKVVVDKGEPGPATDGPLERALTTVGTQSR